MSLLSMDILDILDPEPGDRPNIIAHVLRVSSQARTAILLSSGVTVKIPVL